MSTLSQPPLPAKVRPHFPEAAGRSVLNLNPGWSFKRCDTPGSDTPPSIQDDGRTSLTGPEWEPVTLPHTVRLEPLNASGGRNFQGVCWYARVIRLAPEHAGRTLYLHFGAAMQTCDVWLNGQKLGTHFGGYMPFVFDITGQVTPGEDNLLIVRLDNTDQPDVPPGKPQRELDFCYFGGLYRNVWLETVNPLHVSDTIHADRVGGGGVLVTFPTVSDAGAVVRVTVDVRNAGAQAGDGEVRLELIDPDGRTVSQSVAAAAFAADAFTAVTQMLEVEHPRLWHPDHPDLYTLRTCVLEHGRVVDVTTTRVGIRRIEFSTADGLLINGRKYASFGANRHQDHPYVGYALSDAAQWRDVRKLKEAGFTSYRSHYPQAPAFMDACDALGVLAIVSNPGWQYCGGELFQRRALQNTREMVRRDRNRPSVVLWEAALNESDNRQLAAALHAAVHEEAPGDQTFTAGDRNAHFVGPEHGDQPPSVWDVDYLHNDGSKPYWVREWGDRVDNWSDQQSANRVARGWGEGPMLTQALSHLRQWDELLRAHHGSPTGHRLAGACLWAGVDCQRGYHHQPFYGGVMDAWRLPKFDFYLFQSQRPPEQGPMVFVANFASFLSPTTVTVFSNCDRVRLSLNGHEVATQSPDAGHRVPHPPFTFRVDHFAAEHSTMFMNPASPGTLGTPPQLRAEGLIGGRVVATHTVSAPGQPKTLALAVDLAGHDLVADGADFVRVHATVCDAHGTPCPLADDRVTFAVTGPATLIEAPGLDANPTVAVGGIATALVRSTARPGPIRVVATAFGLEPAETQIVSIADARFAPPTVPE